MAYNRWLAHHGVKGQKWGERNGPPYPLDRSISTGSKLIKGDGSPQGKKKYKTSEKTTHKRAERKARTDSKNDERDYKRLQNFFNRHVGWDEIDAIDYNGRINIELEDLARSVVDGKISKKEYNKRASAIRDEIRKRIDEEAANGSEWAPDTQKRLAKVDKYHRAADEDTYDLDFLESVQNEQWYNDKKRMLKEYSDYLKDRDTYAQRGLVPQVTAASVPQTSELNGRPLTEKVRSRTEDDIKAIEEAQKYDDQQHRRILNGANFLANAKTLGFKISRYGSDSDNGLPVKKKETSKDYDLKTINPGGKSTTLSGTNNCLLCTVAYDMRRRGYNVIARQRAPIELLYDIGDEDLSNMYKHTKTISDESLRGITNKIKRQKNSRGSISCTWNGSNSGHVVAYEVNDGKVTLYDAQSGTRYDDPSKLFSDAHNFRAVRLDNLTPDYRLIKLAVE